MSKKIIYRTFGLKDAKNSVLDKDGIKKHITKNGIYKYNYYDKKGNLIEKTVNQYERIQSHRPQTDYKSVYAEQLKKGEVINGNNQNGVYMDTTKLGGDIIEHLHILQGYVDTIKQNQSKLDSKRVGEMQQNYAEIKSQGGQSEVQSGQNSEQGGNE